MTPTTPTTTTSPSPLPAFSWPAALALAVAAGAAMGAVVLRALLYEPGLRRGLVRRAPLWAAGAQGVLALLLLVRLPW